MDSEVVNSVVKKTLKKKTLKFKGICHEFSDSDVSVNIMVSIYLIESHFRPTFFRLAEYCVSFSAALFSLVLGIPMKNYTIGICQLGVSTICNCYGSNYYQHQQFVRVRRLVDFFHIISIISMRGSAKALHFRLMPMIKNACQIYPNSINQQLNYIGEQYNGKFSYGLLLSEVYEIIREK